MKCRRSGRIHGKAELIVQRNSKRAALIAKSRRSAPGIPRAKVRRMCGNFEGCHAFAHVGFIGQPQCSLGVT